MTRRRRQLRLAVAVVPLCAAIVAILIANARSTSPSNDPRPAGRTHAAHASDRLAAADSVLRGRRIGMLPAPLQDAAAVSLEGEHLVLLGGLDGTDTSTAAIAVLAAGRAESAGRLPEAQHDAQGASLDGEGYVFGGGQFSSYDHILRFDPANGRVSVAGHLPEPASDVAVTSIGNTAYIIGGYNGERALDTILAWRPGGIPTIVGRLPVGLRYAAVAAVGSKVIVAGGSTEAVGSIEAHASSAILSFDPSTGRVTKIGSLPAPLTHASAASFGGILYVIGGRGSAPDSQTAAILAIDPANGRVSHAGALARPLSDAAVAIVGGHILIAGGQSASGTQAAIYELTPEIR
jgi:N-acetylneuraminic acid mutarotase